MRSLVELAGIDKSFQMGDTTVHALKSANLSVAPGEFLAILGPSGSGKSTLMNVIGCMDTADSGEYHLAGLPIHEIPDSRLALVRNRLIGFVFQRYHLISTYSVLQNVMIPLLVRGVSHREASEKACECLKMLGMEQRLLHKPHELSGGQQQRTAIARALVGSPQLLLADEPTGALDSATGRDVMRLFGQLNEMGHAVIVITHDIQIAACARRILRISDGVLTEDPAEAAG
jgi:putative ABC transport system ATP-binding protein